MIRLMLLSYVLIVLIASAMWYVFSLSGIGFCLGVVVGGAVWHIAYGIHTGDWS